MGKPSHKMGDHLNPFMNSSGGVVQRTETRLGGGEGLWYLPSYLYHRVPPWGGPRDSLTELSFLPPTPWNLEPDDNESTSQNVSPTEVLFNVETPNDVLDEKQICKFELEYLTSSGQNSPLGIHTLDFQAHVH